MRYINIVKKILDNYYFTTYPKKFDRDGDLIAGQNPFMSTIFNHQSYRITGDRDVFHDKKIVDFLSEYGVDVDVRLETALNSNKRVVIGFDLHPIPAFENPFETTKTYFIDKLFNDSEILQKMREGKVILFLYQGWEAENFRESTFPKDKYKGYYDLFDTILEEYNIPESSIVILCSNLLGKNYEDKYRTKVIHDSALELHSFFPFLKNGGSFTKFNKYSLNYPIEEYIKNIKKSKYDLLRISRTYHPTRDWMLYIIHKLKYFERSIIEQKYFRHENIIYDGAFCASGKDEVEKDNSLLPISKVFKAHYDENNIPHGTQENLIIKKQDKKIFDKIKDDLPYVASKFEKNRVYKSKDIHSNRAIPHDVYRNSIFSWVSVSLPDHKNMVFLNQSTFNPVLNYHPILWFGHKHTIKYFKESGYKSYDWLFDESSDNIDEEKVGFGVNTWKRMVHNLREIHKVMNYDRDKLVSIIENNKNDLNYNRELLFKCKSIERIITKFYDIVEDGNEK